MEKKKFDSWQSGVKGGTFVPELFVNTIRIWRGMDYAGNETDKRR